MTTPAVDTVDIEAKDLATKKDLLELKSDITRMFINGMLALAGFMVASLAVVVALLK